ncbi:EndoU domain-containing protein, partial [Agathobacter rectalis]|uniref:EndoU domain-containing protein n=2 Tax=Lachnospiraceae TaxID=186803 RepID=UPI0034A50EF2
KVMEEEIKKAYMDWSEKGVSYLNCMYVYDIMMDVDEALQTCDTILDEIDLGIDYTSREKDIDRLLEGHGTLHRYIDVLNCYVDDKLDQPLKKDFKKNATETISRIHLEDFEVDITLGLTENNYITGGMGYAGTMVEQEKAKLTFADFIGTSDGKADGNGLHMAYTNGSVEDFASIFAAQYEAMKASEALGEDNNLTQQEFLEQFYRQGEFTHDSSNPFLNFVSSVLDITIIKPVIEACTGEDLITGEDLTDMERGLKVVFAVVDLVTLGGAIAATKFSEMGLKEGLKAFGKTALIDFAGNTAACGVGALGETFDWPVPITMMLSLAAGITVSISGNKLLFKNADGIEIGSKTLSDDDLKIVEQTIEGENYSNLTEVVSAKEAEVYLHFLESGSTEGMTESELKAVQKIEELIKSNKIDYDGILKIRNETVKSDVEVVRKTTEDSVEDVGKNAAEDAGKVVETSYGKSTLNSLKNTENFTDSAIEHIFEGQVNARGKAVGYHYEGIEGTSGNVIPGTESSVNNIGVYKAQVEVNGIPKTANGGFSTFYSKNLSPQQVVDAINEAYSNCELKLGTRNTYQGVANNGMKIDMFLDQSGKIISAFPEE